MRAQEFLSELQITSDLGPQSVGISLRDLDALSESSGSNYQQFDHNISKNLRLAPGRGIASDTMSLYGAYLSILNEGVADRRISDIERELFKKFSQRCADSIDSAVIGDSVSLLQLVTLDIPGHRLVARLSGFLRPKEITDISTRNNIRYLKFSDGSSFPDSNNDDPIFMMQQLSMTRLFDSYAASSKAYSLYALEGRHVSDQVDFLSRADTSSQQPQVTEVQILSRVKGKGSQPSQLPRMGRPIEPGREEYYLGKKVGNFDGYTVWRDWLGGQLSYHLFDPRTRVAILTTFGSQYKGNPRSYIIHGLYAAPGNTVKAHQFYRNLIVDQGLTLISDRKQSPGGNRVWQRLEAYPDVTVYGYDTKTGETLNFGARDSEMYAVSSRAAAGSREMQKVARDIRLVATAK